MPKITVGITAYDPTTLKVIRQLPQPQALTWDVEFNNISLLSIDYSSLAEGVEELNQEVALISVDFFLENAKVTDISRNWFYKDSSTVEEMKLDKPNTYGLVGIENLLTGAFMWPLPGVTDLEINRKFNSSTVGTILLTMLQDNKALGWGGPITWNFTNTTDSNGVAWNASARKSLEYGPLERHGYDILTNLANQGMCDWEVKNNELRVYNPGTLERYANTQTPPVHLKFRTDVTNAVMNTSLENFVTHVVVIGEGGKTWTFPVPDAITSLGRQTKIIKQGGVSDEATAQAFATAATQGLGNTVQSVTRKVSTLNYAPHVDVKVGDWILTDTLTPQKQLVPVRMQVKKISVTYSKKVGVEAHYTLGTVLDSLTARLVKRTNGIAGSATTGGNGSRPAPAGTDKRAPQKVEGVRVTSFATPDEQTGIVRASVQIEYNSVNGADGNAIDIDRYEFFSRPNIPGREFQFIGWQQNPEIFRTGESTDGRGYLPGTTWQFRVRAISRAGVIGPFSDIVTHAITGDDIPPPVPSTPILTSTLETITVKWDGNTFNGNDMKEAASDFRRCLVDMRATGSGTWIMAAAELSEPGMSTVITGFKRNVTAEFRFRAEDTTGNLSQPSTTATIKVTGVMDDPDAIAAVKAANDAAIDASNAAANAALAAANIGATNDKRFTTSTNGPTSTSGYPEGAYWTRVDASNNIIGTWYLKNGAWLATGLEPTYIGVLRSANIGADTIEGRHLAADSVGSKQVVVADHDNWILNPNLEQGIKHHNVYGNSTIDTVADESTKDVGGTGTALRVAWKTSSSDGYNFVGAMLSSGAPGANPTQEDSVSAHPVTEGDTIYASCQVAKNVSQVEVDKALQLYMFDATGKYVSARGGPWTTPAGFGAWAKMEAKWEIPAGVKYVRLGLRSAGRDGYDTYRFCNFFMARQTGSVLIKDGAVNAVHVNAASISADIALMNSVWAGVVNAGKVNAQAVTSNIFEGDTFTGGTFVGPRVCTALTGARTEINTTGFYQFRANNSVQTSINKDGFYTDGGTVWTSSGTNSAGLTANVFGRNLAGVEFKHPALTRKSATVFLTDTTFAKDYIPGSLLAESGLFSTSSVTGQLYLAPNGSWRLSNWETDSTKANVISGIGYDSATQVVTVQSGKGSLHLIAEDAGTLKFQGPLEYGTSLFKSQNFAFFVLESNDLQYSSGTWGYFDLNLQVLVKSPGLYYRAFVQGLGTLAEYVTFSTFQYNASQPGNVRIGFRCVQNMPSRGKVTALVLAVLTK